MLFGYLHHSMIDITQYPPNNYALKITKLCLWYLCNWHGNGVLTLLKFSLIPRFVLYQVQALFNQLIQLLRFRDVMCALYGYPYTRYSPRGCLCHSLLSTCYSQSSVWVYTQPCYSKIRVWLVQNHATFITPLVGHQSAHPANTRYWPIVVLMLCRRWRRRANISNRTTLGQWLCLLGTSYTAVTKIGPSFRTRPSTKAALGQYLLQPT